MYNYYNNYYGYYDMSYFLFMIISVIISGYAQFKVQSAFNKYSRVKSRSGITGSETAQKILNYNNIFNIFVEHTPGYFSDHFDSRSQKIRLSNSVYYDSSITSISVAAHESGHATQYAQDYFPLRLRHALVPVTQIGSNLAMPLIILGFMIPNWSFAVNLGIIMFSTALIFQIVTLPVEFDASKRALEFLKSMNILTEPEIEQAKHVLKAAALTYVAAMFTSLLSLLRLIWASRNRRR